MKIKLNENRGCEAFTWKNLDYGQLFIDQDGDILMVIKNDHQKQLLYWDRNGEPRVLPDGEQYINRKVIELISCSEVNICD